MPYATQSLADKVVLVTGASAGIGQATARRFAEEGCRKLVLVARRAERLEQLAQELSSKHGAACHTITIDLSKEFERIVNLPAELPEEFRAVDILVNNAGLALGKNAADANELAPVQTMINTNVTAAIMVASTFLKEMKARSKGHVINIGSIAGHETYAGGSVYAATKHALTAFTASARHDLVGTPLRVTCISPGAVETEFSVVRFGGDEAKAAAVYKDLVSLVADDIADQIWYAATRPAHVQVADLVALCTNQSGAMNLARVGPTLGAGSGAA